MNLLDETQANRLFTSIEKNYRHMGHFRRSRLSLIEDYVGPSFPDSYWKERGVIRSGKECRSEYINLMHQTAEAYSIALVANRPRYRISTQFQELEYFRVKYELALNRRVGEMELERVFQRAVLDAFFTLGVVKVYQGDHIEVMLENDVRFDPGQCCASNISLDNFVIELNTDIRRATFAADWYRIPESGLKDSRFDQELAKKIKATPRPRYGPSGEILASSLVRGGDSEAEDVEPMVSLVDVWLPRENRVATFPVSQDFKFSPGSKPLSYVPWDGPELGPYHYLSFGEVPDSAIGTSPAANMQQLFRLADNLMRKLAIQARMQKDLLVVEQGDGEDARALRVAKQGQTVGLRNPEGVRPTSIAGMNAGTMIGLDKTMQLASRGAGNLDSMLGLGPQSSTVGQDQLINSSVSERMAQLKLKVGGFAVGIGSSVGKHMWIDESLEMSMENAVEGTDIVETVHWTPEDREGDFLDFNFDLDLHSLPYKSPESQWAASMDYLDRLAGFGYPVAEIIAIEELHAAATDLIGMPRMARWLKAGGDELQDREEAYDPGEGSKLRPRTKREYIRTNRSQSTPDSRNQVMSQMLAGMANGGGAGVNPQQVAGVM